MQRTSLDISQRFRRQHSPSAQPCATVPDTDDLWTPTWFDANETPHSNRVCATVPHNGLWRGPLWIFPQRFRRQHRAYYGSRHRSVMKTTSGCHLSGFDVGGLFIMRRFHLGEYAVMLSGGRRLHHERRRRYEVTVTCADHGEPTAISTLPLSVIVLEENDNAPEFPVNPVVTSLILFQIISHFASSIPRK